MTSGLKGALTRRVHVCYSNTRGGTVEDAGGYLARVPGSGLAPLVASKGDKRLMQKARLDCDWHAENARCFAEMTHDGVEFLLAWIWGPAGKLELDQRPREAGEEHWLIATGLPQCLVR